jgi:copper chaperone CopZ
MTEQLYRVPEIHCGACEASIRRALEPLPGIDAVEVDVPGKTVRVRHDAQATPDASIRAAIENAGFDVEE